MLLRVRLPDGRVLTACSEGGKGKLSSIGGGIGNANANVASCSSSPSSSSTTTTITLGRRDVRGAKRASTVPRRACVLTAARVRPTVEAVGSTPVVIHRRVASSSSSSAAAAGASSSSAASASAASASASARRLVVVARPGGPAREICDGDGLQLCESAEGDEEDARASLVVVEVVSVGGEEEKDDDTEKEQGQKEKEKGKQKQKQQQQPKEQQQQQPKEQGGPLPQLLLVLTGLPGSGKTTFAEAVLSHASAASDDEDESESDDSDDGDNSDGDGEKNNDKKKISKPPRERTRPWVRVNADARQETRDWCVEAARRALSRGRNVVVDRCNVSRQDRAAFLSLAREEREQEQQEAGKKARIQAHLVFLDVPRQRCVERTYFRRHEASVQGAGAPAVVARLASAFERPAAEGEGGGGKGEGFDGFEVLRSDLESDAAAERWGRMGATASREAMEGAAAATAATEAAAAAKSSTAKKRSAFDVMMMSSSSSAQKGASPSPSPPPRKKPTVPAFLNGLLQISRNPDAANPGAAVARVPVGGRNKTLLILPDKYPKAAKHFLVLQETIRGREREIVGSPRDLRGPEHASLVRDMLSVARRRVSSESKNKNKKNKNDGDDDDACSDFRFGFHSEPSLAPLHLHAISQDLCGTAMARKKHYNSFKSPFFVDAENVLAALERGESGASALLSPAAAAAALAAPLKCHRCGAAPIANMLVLRRHLEEHERELREQRVRGGKGVK